MSPPYNVLIPVNQEIRVLPAKCERYYPKNLLSVLPLGKHKLLKIPQAPVVKAGKVSVKS